MRPDGKEKSELKDDLFLWTSADGSSLAAYRIPTLYGHLWEAPEKGNMEKQKIQRSLEIAGETGQPVMNL